MICLPVKDIVEIPQADLLGIAKVGEPVSLSCSVLHTCPSTPPTLTLSITRGTPKLTQTPLHDGKWKTTIEITWTVEENDKSVTCTVSYAGGQTTKTEISINPLCESKTTGIHFNSQSPVCHLLHFQSFSLKNFKLTIFFLRWLSRTCNKSRRRWGHGRNREELCLCCEPHVPKRKTKHNVELQKHASFCWNTEGFLLQLENSFHFKTESNQERPWKDANMYSSNYRGNNFRSRYFKSKKWVSLHYLITSPKKTSASCSHQVKCYIVKTLNVCNHMAL